MGKFSVPFICPLWAIQPGLRPSQPGLTDGQTNGRTDKRTDGWMEGRTDGQMDGRTDGQKDRWTDRWTDGQTDRQTDGTESLPILQDFVPYQARCPASPQKDQEISLKDKSKEGQGNR